MKSIIFLLTLSILKSSIETKMILDYDKCYTDLERTAINNKLTDFYKKSGR